MIIPKIGDWVLLVSNRPKTWNKSGKMDEFLGRTVQVTHVGETTFQFMGSKPWVFSLLDIEKIVEQEPQLIDNYSII